MLIERRNELEAAVTVASAALKAFPKGQFGMTTDAVKATPEWKAARRQYTRAFEALRTFNADKARS